MSMWKDDDSWIFSGFGVDLQNHRIIATECFCALYDKCKEVGLLGNGASAIAVLNLVRDLAFGNMSLEDVIRTRQAIATTPTAMEAEQARLRKLSAGFQMVDTATEYHGPATLHFSCTDGNVREVVIPSGSHIMVLVH